MNMNEEIKERNKFIFSMPDRRNICIEKCAQPESCIHKTFIKITISKIFFKQLIMNVMK